MKPTAILFLAVALCGCTKDPAPTAPNSGIEQGKVGILIVEGHRIAVANGYNGTMSICEVTDASLVKAAPLLESVVPQSQTITNLYSGITVRMMSYNDDFMDELTRKRNSLVKTNSADIAPAAIPPVHVPTIDEVMPKFQIRTNSPTDYRIAYMAWKETNWAVIDIALPSYEAAQSAIETSKQKLFVEYARILLGGKANAEKP